MRLLDYKSPGPEDQRERLARWESRLLIISFVVLFLGVVAIYLCFGVLGRR